MRSSTSVLLPPLDPPQTHSCLYSVLTSVHPGPGLGEGDFRPLPWEYIRAVTVLASAQHPEMEGGVSPQAGGNPPGDQEVMQPRLLCLALGPHPRWALRKRTRRQ